MHDCVLHVEHLRVRILRLTDEQRVMHERRDQVFESGCKRFDFLACSERLDDVGSKRFNDRSRFFVAIDDHDWVEPAAPKGVVHADSLTESTEVANLDRPADSQRSVGDVDANGIHAYAFANYAAAVFIGR